MKIEYSLTRHDLIEFNYYHLLNSKSTVRTLKYLRIVPPISMLIIPFIIELIFKTEVFLAFFITFIISASFAVSWFVRFPKKHKKNMTKSLNNMLDEGKNSGVLGERTIELNDEGIHLTNPGIETSQKWDSVEKLCITDDYIYIYVSSLTALIVPTGVFRNTEEKEEFLDIVKKNMPSDSVIT